MKSQDLIQYLNDLLDIPDSPDFSGAYNGVQVELPEEIKTIATTVDACAATCEQAAELDADLLIVHHGLLWAGTRPFVGDLYRSLKNLIGTKCGLYSAHLPLDGHDEFGNNAILAKTLNLKDIQAFGDFKGAIIGRIGQHPGLTAAKAAELLGYAVEEAVAPSEPVDTIAVVSGSAGSLWQEAQSLGAQVLLTGEGNHHLRVDARDGGMGIWFGGHYNTETVGVRALGAHLAEKFALKHEFIDLPTGG